MSSEFNEGDLVYDSFLKSFVVVTSVTQPAGYYDEGKWLRYRVHDLGGAWDVHELADSIDLSRALITFGGPVCVYEKPRLRGKQ